MLRTHIAIVLWMNQTHLTSLDCATLEWISAHAQDHAPQPLPLTIRTVVTICERGLAHLVHGPTFQASGIIDWTLAGQ